MDRNKTLQYNLQKQAQPLYQDTIDRFFLKKEPRIVYTGPEISILQALLNDFQFCSGIGVRLRDLALTPEQETKLRDILPTFATITIYCTAIELFARVIHKREPKTNSNEGNEKFFKESAKNWFNLSAEQAAELWKLRNAVSHHYKLEKQHHIAPSGNAGVAYKMKNDFWIFSIEKMHKSFLDAINKLYKKISEGKNKKEFADYLNNNCFIYILPSKK